MTESELITDCEDCPYSENCPCLWMVQSLECLKLRRQGNGH